MNKLLNNASISFKFNAIALIGVTLILSVFGYINYSDSKKTLYEELENNSKLISHRLQINLPSLIWNFQTEQIAQVLDAELSPVYVNSIMVFEDDEYKSLLLGKQINATNEIEEISELDEAFSPDSAIISELNYIDEVGDQSKVGQVLLYLDTTQLEQTLNALVIRLAVQTLLLDAVVLIMLTLLCRIIVTNPINQVTKAMEDIAQGEGDLTQRLEKSSGEIGKLSENFNLFVANIQQLVKSIHKNMESMVSLSHDLSGTAKNTNDRVSDQKNETELVATATHEMSVTSGGIANNAGEAANASKSGANNIELTKKVFDTTISSVKQLADDIDQGATAINRVREDVLSIGSVLDVIGTIAEQTNLLALNAAIEAARAGEQGRGFAVVADEVRSLAQRTQQSTGEVHKMLDQLRTGAQTAVDVIEAGRNQGQKTLEEAGGAEESLNAITDSITQIDMMNEEIANTISEQTKVSEDINERITRIFELTVKTEDDAQTTTKHASSVYELSFEVKDKIEKLTRF